MPAVKKEVQEHLMGAIKDVIMLGNPTLTNEDCSE